MAISIGELVAGGMPRDMAKKYLREAKQEINPPSPAQYMRRNKMAKKPDAARGKTTRIGRIKKIAKGLRERAKSKTGMNMSPGAMGGRTKTKMPLQRMTPEQRRQRLKGLRPMTGSMGKAAKSTIKGAGASGAAMSGQAMKLAKQLKTTGRLSVQDLMRAKKMMMGRKGK